MYMGYKEGPKEDWIYVSHSRARKLVLIAHFSHLVKHTANVVAPARRTTTGMLVVMMHLRPSHAHARLPCNRRCGKAG